MQIIPADVARKLKYYVYLYVHPGDGRVFYVGKGKGRRAAAHLVDRSDNRKVRAIRAIREAGAEPRIEILAHGLPNEEAAFRLEAAVIDLLGLPRLTNRVRGWRTARLGRVTLPQLVAMYRRKPALIREPALLIRINRLYRPTMSAVELYDATRSSWRLGPDREGARYAFAVYEGIVREVYEILKWLPAGSTFNTRNPHGLARPDRWEFVGRVAPEAIRRRYLDRDVSRYFKQGSQNPISYVNLQPSRSGRRRSTRAV